MKKILIIEDEKMLIDALETKLKESDFEVFVAGDGAKGLQIAMEVKPDLILLDLILPVMDGVRFLEDLRNDDWGKDAKVVVLSNLSEIAAPDKIKKQDISAYLVKTDWKLSKVIDKVKEVLGVE